MSQRLIDLAVISYDHPEGLIDRLLGYLSDAAVEGDDLQTVEFRNQIIAYRKRIIDSSGTPDFTKYASECLRVCEDFFDRSKKYLIEREGEIKELVKLLRESIGMLSGDSNSFNGQLMRTSERFDRLAEIEDIRKLRKQLLVECTEFKRIVIEKQADEEASYNRLNRRIELLQSNLEHTREAASKDSLTCVSNRSSFDVALNRWIEAHDAARKPFILAFLDLDNFKGINDRYGHQVGDKVLNCAAQWFKKYVRINDFLGRYGGDEFVILLSDATLKQAVEKFSDLLSRISGANYKYDVASEIADVSFTVSCGVAEYVPGEGAESIVRRADAALYDSKGRGKNNVAISEAPKKSKGLWSTLQPLIPFKS